MTLLDKLILSLLALSLPMTASSDGASREQMEGLDEQVQEIKKDVLGISAELNLLEEKLLYPSNTQVSLFVSLNKGSDYELDAVQIKIDGRDIAHHIYSFKEVDALRRGGVQRIYTGNVSTGDHELVVFVNGKNGGGSPKTEQATYTINKGIGPKLVEINLRAGGSAIQFKDQ